MNEAMNISKKYPFQTNVQIEKLELNDADLVNMKDMKIVTITIRNNTNKEPCGNCSITTRNASVEKFKYEVEDVENFSGCNH